MIKYLGWLIMSAFLAQSNSEKIDYRSRIDQLYSNISHKFASRTPGLYIETTDTVRNKNKYSYLWPLCALMQAANEMEVVEPGKDYLAPFLKTLKFYYNADPPMPGYQAYVASAGKDTRYIDDNQWIGLTFIDAYTRTRKQEYLDMAEVIYRFMMTGYDTVSGGGLYWREGDKTTKNTCSNGPGIILSLQLYKATGENEYLENARDLYNWVNRYLRSPEGIYYDALKVKTMRIDSATYTYNTGTMLQSNVLFYLITSDKTYLNEARIIADAAKNRFYRNNRLPDNYWFNAVLLRGFVELCKVDGNSDRLQFFIDDAEQIWNTQRDENGLIGRRTAKRLIDQAAMLEIFARLQTVQLNNAR